MDFPIKITQSKQSVERRDILDRIIKRKITPKSRNSHYSKGDDLQDINQELRLENSMLKKKVELLQMKIEELEKRLENKSDSNSIQEEQTQLFQFNSMQIEKQQDNELTEEEQSLQFALQLQEQEQIEFQNRLFMLQAQVDPDEMSYEQLQELGEKMGIVSKGLKEDQLLKLINKCKLTESCTDFCTICLEDSGNPVEIQLPCGHVFHENCIGEWLSRQKECPVCKREIKLD